MTRPLGLADLPEYRAALEPGSGSEGPAAAVGFRDLWDHPERYRGRRVQVEGRIVRRFRQEAVGTFPAADGVWVVAAVGRSVLPGLPRPGARRTSPRRGPGPVRRDVPEASALPGGGYRPAGPPDRGRPAAGGVGAGPAARAAARAGFSPAGLGDRDRRDGRRGLDPGPTIPQPAPAATPAARSRRRSSGRRGRRSPTVPRRPIGPRRPEHDRRRIAELGRTPLTDPRSLGSSLLFHAALLLAASLVVLGSVLPGEPERAPDAARRARAGGQPGADPGGGRRARRARGPGPARIGPDRRRRPPRRGPRRATPRPTRCSRRSCPRAARRRRRSGPCPAR